MISLLGAPRPPPLPFVFPGLSSGPVPVFTMMNGQAKSADRERMERLAKATGKKQWDLQDEMDTRDYRPTKQARLWRENSGQHYPGFLDAPSVAPKPAAVKIAAPARKKLT